MEGLVVLRRIARTPPPLGGVATWLPARARNVFEQLWWCLGTLALVRLLAGERTQPATRTARGRGWLALGAALGLAALTKFSVAFLAAGLVVAIPFSSLRLDLRTPWPWLGAALAAVLAAPSIVGQAVWGWPFLEQAQALQANQLGNFDRLEFVGGQFLLLGPGAPLWLIGLVGLLITSRLRPFRALGLLSLAVFVLLLLTGGKDYYFGPLHPLLIGAAAIVLQRPLERPLVFAGATVWLVLGGLALAPLGVPLLAPEPMARYAAGPVVSPATETNYGGRLPLPQDFADMTGWRELVATVDSVFRSLEPAEQKAAAILGNNYGRTAAVALFGREYGLPYPISRHGDFFFWGARGQSGEVTIIMGGTRDQWQRYWGKVAEVARTGNPWGVDEEQRVPIFLARNPLVDLPTMFERLGPEWG